MNESVVVILASHWLTTTVVMQGVSLESRVMLSANDSLVFLFYHHSQLTNIVTVVG